MLALIVLVMIGATAVALLWLFRFRLYNTASELNWLKVRRELFWPSLFVVIVLVLFLLIEVPRLQVEGAKFLSDADRIKSENEARQTIAQILGGAFLLAGLYSSLRALNVTRDGQITDRFTRAIEQIGNQRLEVRLGGIYALERIARDSDKDHTTINEVLTAYIRERSPRTDQWNPEPTPSHEARRVPADIQAILDVLGWRKWIYDKETLDLGQTDLRGASLNGDFSKANFREAILDGADLNWVNLDRAILSGAHLNSAMLSGARLNAARLNRAILNDAILNGASLNAASLRGASLQGARLYAASLHGADLSRADLNGAHLSGVSLSEADFDGAAINGASFKGASLSGATNLTQDQIESASGDSSTTLPPSLTRPASWNQ